MLLFLYIFLKNFFVEKLRTFDASRRRATKGKDQRRKPAVRRDDSHKATPSEPSFQERRGAVTNHLVPSLRGDKVIVESYRLMVIHVLLPCQSRNKKEPSPARGALLTAPLGTYFSPRPKCDGATAGRGGGGAGSFIGGIREFFF